jgi:hypothetical protein
MKSVKDLKGYPFNDPYKGEFECYGKQLTALEGCPKVVNGHFNCSFNKLQSLQYCPQIVKGNFYCFSNKLQSLQYCPQIVEGDFLCSNNNLQSLQYCPQIIEGDFNCYNNKLQSLQYCPQIVKGNFYCSDNKLPSLQNIHKFCKQIGGNFRATINPIKSHVLGVMLIENIRRVILTMGRHALEPIEQIINTHLKTDRDVYLCQDNLIKAGFAEYAQL